MLRDLVLQPVYDSSEYDHVQDLIAPLLAESHEYWRGVGFFTSGWLKTACKGIVRLVSNGGMARIVTSPLMQKADWEALQFGDNAKRDSVLRDILREQVADLTRALSQDSWNIRTSLARALQSVSDRAGWPSSNRSAIRRAESGAGKSRRNGRGMEMVER